MLEHLAETGNLKDDDSDAGFQALYLEIKSTRKKTALLPTIRESEALPELQLLHRVAQTLATKKTLQLTKILADSSRLSRLFYEDYLEGVCGDIIRARAYCNKEIVKVADQIFSSLVIYAAGRAADEIPALYALLNTIIDKNADYYKTNGKESNFMEWPFGEQLQASGNMVQWLTDLKKGDVVDCVKSFSSRKSWSRAVYDGMDGTMARVRFVNESNYSFIANPEFEMAPAGTKSTDYDWREGLKVGDLVDYFHYKSEWILARVEKMTYEENMFRDMIKTVYIRCDDGKTSEQKEEQMSQAQAATLAYADDVSSFLRPLDQTFPIKVHSPSIAPPGTRSGANNIAINDIEDESLMAKVKEPKFAILRAEGTAKNNSIYFVRYLNAFGVGGGFDFLVQVANGGHQAKPETTVALTEILQNSAEFIVAPFIRQHGKLLLDWLTETIGQNIERNIRGLSQQNLTNYMEAVAVLTKRVHPEEESAKMGYDVIVRVAIVCLRSEILEKQFFGAKKLIELEEKIKGENQVVQRLKLAKLLVENGIFERIIKGHPNLIEKGAGVLRVLFTENMVNEEQIGMLWEQVRKADMESKSALLALIKDSSWDASPVQTRCLLGKIMDSPEEPSTDFLETILALRKAAQSKHKDTELVNLLNGMIWKLVQEDNEERPELSRELIRAFVKNIPLESRTLYFVRTVDQLLLGHAKQRQLKILKKMMKEPGLITAAIGEKLREKQVVDFCINEIKRNFDISDAQTDSETASQSTKQTATRQEGPIPVRKVLAFLNSLMGHPHANDMQQLFTFADFERIYDIIFDSGVQQSQIHRWLHDYLKEHKRPADLPHYHRFFETRLPKLVKPGGEDYFQFYVMLFLVINEMEGALVFHKVPLANPTTLNKTTYKSFYVPEKPFEEQFGGKLMWETLLAATSFRLFSQIAAFISNFNLQSEFGEHFGPELYAAQKRTLIEKSYQLFMKGESLSGQKAAVLFSKVIKNDEIRRGFGLISFAQLKEGTKIKLAIEKEHSYIKQRTPIEMYNNQTMVQLREAVAAEFRLSYEIVGLAREGCGDFNTMENIMTLDALGFGNFTVLTLKERDTDIGDGTFMNELKTDFSINSKRALREVFNEYGSDNRMSREQFKRLQVALTSTLYKPLKDDAELLFFDSQTERKDEEGQDSGKRVEFINFEQFLEALRFTVVSGGDRGVLQLKQGLSLLGFSKNLRPRRYPVESEPAEIQKSIRLRLANDKAFCAQLLEYIKPFFVSETNDSVASDESIESQSNHQALQLFTGLLDILPPSFESVKAAWLDPVSFLSGLSNQFEIYHRSVILEAMLFRQDFQAMLRRFHPETFATGQAGFLARVITKQTLGKLNEVIRTAGTEVDVSGWSGRITAPIRLLDRLLKTTLLNDEPEFISSLSALSYYIVRKRQNQQETGAKADKQEPARPASADGNNRIRGILKNSESKQTNRDTKNTPVDKHSEEQRISNFLSAIEENGLLGTLKAAFNYSEINSTIMQIMSQFVSTVSGSDASQIGLIRSLVSALASSVKLREQELGPLLAGETFSKVMLRGMTGPSTATRIYVKNAYSLIASEAQSVEFKTALLKTLISALGSEEREELHGLVEVSCAILGQIGELKSRNPEIDKYLHSALNFGDLFKNFKRLLMAHKSTEKQLDDEPDGLLVGYLALLEKTMIADESVLFELSKREKQELILFVFKRCLFEVEGENIRLDNVLCKSRRSRTLALGFLKLLLKGNPRLEVLFLAMCLGPLSRAIPTFQEQSQLMANPERRAKNGYVGIKNPGCVCYMIATLQQFYCTPVFRYGVLMADDGQPPKPVTVRNVTVDDNVFHQFQKMLAYLDNSERRDYDPAELCYSYKDYSGEPTNVSVQQDADEFLKVLLERLENSLKNSPFIGVLNSAFLGKVCNVITCKGCGHEKTNEENFYNISLEVKKMRNLTESLDKLIQEEIVSDYLCESCKKKCDISKRALLKKLPNVLVFSLKKMCFDLQLLMNVKIHNRYEFPMNVNLKNYMYKPSGKEQSGEEEADEGKETVKEEELSLEDCEYRLVGVVIHKGNAEYGHYTSIINTDRGDPGKQGQSPDTWMEFDDSKVSVFDMTKFDEECFGSQEDKEAIASEFAMENFVSKSAYLLFYEKVKKDPLVLPFSPETEALRPFVRSQLVDPKAATETPEAITTTFYNLKPYCPNSYLEEIKAGNHLLSLEQNLLSKQFTNTLAEIIYNIDLSCDQLTVSEPPSEQTILKRELAKAMLVTLPQVLQKIYNVAYENFKVRAVTQGIHRALTFLIYSKSFKKGWEEATDNLIAAFFFENMSNRLGDHVQLIISTNDMPLRAALTELIVDVYSATIENFEIESLHDIDHPPADSAEPDKEQSLKAKVSKEIYANLKLIADALALIDNWSVSNKRLANLFGLVGRMAQNNNCILRYLSDHDFLQTTYELYMNTDGERLLNMERVLTSLLMIIRVLYEFQEHHSEENESYMYQVNEMPKAALIQKALSEDHREDLYEELKALVRLFCTDDRVTTEIVVFHCLRSYATRTEVKAVAQLEGLKAMLSIHDEMDNYRLRLVFGVPRLIQYERQSEVYGQEPVYGLAGKPNLKTQVVSYLSPCAQKKALLDVLWTVKDTLPNMAMLIISYVIDLALDFGDVFEYLLQLDPPNYLSATVYDWWAAYCKYHLRTAETSFGAAKGEFEVNHMSRLPQKLNEFRDRVAAAATSIREGQERALVYAIADTPYPDVFRGSYWSPNFNDATPIISHKKNWIIWDTIDKKTIGKKVLEEVDGRKLVIKVGVVTVELSESKPDGIANSGVPSHMISSNYNLSAQPAGNDLQSVAQQSDHQNIETFKRPPSLDNLSDSSFEVDPKDDSDLALDNTETGAVYEEENNSTKAQVWEERKPKQPEEPKELSEQVVTRHQPLASATEEGHSAISKVKAEYIVRIMSSCTLEGQYIARVKIIWPEVLGSQMEFLSVPIKADANNTLIYTLTKPRLDLGLENLIVSASFKSTKNHQETDLNDIGYSEWFTVYNGKHAAN